ncbi:MAG: NAD(P)/FAD-dependent oxidoreductase [Sandaracinaceae bacterium]
MPKPHTVVIGGGIAGLSVAWALGRSGARRVTVLEQESLVGTHSSARNAQIWLPVDDDVSTGPLAVRSAELMTALMGDEAAWLRRADALVLTEGPGEWVRSGAEKSGLRAKPLLKGLATMGASLRSEATPWRVEGAGVLDPHAMVDALRRACLDENVSIRTHSRAVTIEADDARVTGVHLEGGERIGCDEVVNASGAWAGLMGQGVGLAVPLVPLRRHLMVLEAPSDAVKTTAWHFGARSVYVRPESGGVLACPCDEVPMPPCLPAPDPCALEWLASRLEGIAPSLIDAPVRTGWACLRTYAHDRELVVGPDPRLEGFAWVAGLGGRGMTVGVGAGLLCARSMLGDLEASEHGLAEATRPDRAQPSTLQPA